MTDCSRTPRQVGTIDSVTRRVVAAHAPDETPYYPRIRDEFFERGGRPSGVADNPLGFGSVAVGVVSGIALAVLNELVVGSLTDAMRPWWDRAWQWLLRRLGLRRGRVAGPDAAVPPVPAARVPAVVAAITEHAVRVDMPADQARELAEAIVAELVVPGPGGDDERPG